MWLKVTFKCVHLYNGLAWWLHEKQKHVASYCKQKWTCLPTKLCRLSKNRLTYFVSEGQFIILGFRPVYNFTCLLSSVMKSINYILMCALSCYLSQSDGWWTIWRHCRTRILQWSRRISLYPTDTWKCQSLPSKWSCS